MIADTFSQQICFVNCGLVGTACACYRQMMEDLNMNAQPPIVQDFVSNRDKAISCIADTLMRVTRPYSMSETVAQIYAERIIEDLEAKDWEALKGEIT